MSTAPTGNGSQKKSFAQVAAAANAAKRPVKRDDAQQTPPVEITSTPSVISNGPVGSGNAKGLDESAKQTRDNTQESNGATEVLNGLLQATHLDDTRSPSDSALEALRKDTSDTKSITSRTTLTIDEKESLRPDDSASVQAAHEEDGASLPDSMLAGSRPVNDNDYRAFRAQIYEIDRNGPGRSHPPKPPLPSIPLPQAPGMVGLPNPAAAAIPYGLPMTPNIVAPRGESSQLIVPPDEKLLEALASPKDRLFVLKIEQDMIDFIKDPKEPFLQLPQLNTFYRLLSHKLADYYFLGHHYDETAQALRIYRTPSSRLPAPLIGLEVGTPGATTPPSAPARRIMKRGGKADASDSGNVSLSVSKTPSEIDGNSGSDEFRDPGSKTNGPLSREERENRYKVARARIFAGFEDTDTKEAADLNNENEPSRASSASGANKKSKKKKPKDDSFEARSAYTQVGGHPFMPGSFVQMSQPNGYNPYVQYQAAMGGQYPTDQAGAMSRSTYAVPMGSPPAGPWQSQYAVAPNGSAGFLNTGYGSPNDAYGPAGGYPSPSMQMQLTPRSNAASLANYQPVSSPNENAGWYQTQPQQTYPMGSSMVYGYMAPQQGMPLSPYMGNMQPGSFGGYQQYTPGIPYNQGRFNPQSQAFIPSMQGHQMQGGHATGFPLTAPNLSSSAPMQRQNSGQHFHPAVGSPNGRKGGAQHDAGSNAGNRNHQQSSINSIAKWGTPNHLPPKPPPPASNNSLQARNAEMQQSLPPNPNNKGAIRSPQNGPVKP